jgi:glycosyltransferase involved in cell wall biosynthesis
MILRELQARYPQKIKLVLNEVNRGITANCNAGLAACSGEFIALMGGDDLLLPEKLRLQVDSFKNKPRVVLSYHPCYLMRDGSIGEIIGDRRKDIVTNLVDMIGNFGAQIPGPATMVRATALPIGGFSPEIETASDWLFYIDVSSRGEVIRLDQPLAVYRQHGGNVGERYFSYSEDFLKTLRLVRSRYGDRGGVESAVRRGGTRFLLGIIYRSIEQGRPELARAYAKRLPDYSSRGLSALVESVTWIPGAKLTFKALKAFLKRHV